jgi:hypothetical protein
MFILPIRVNLLNAQRRFSSLIHLGSPSRACRELETRRHESWTAAQAIPATCAKVLDKLLPTVACLSPVCGPILVALMIGCVKLAVRVSPGWNSERHDGTQSTKDAV